jgi:hypothetical protein
MLKLKRRTPRRNYDDMATRYATVEVVEDFHTLCPVWKSGAGTSTMGDSSKRKQYLEVPVLVCPRDILWVDWNAPKCMS